MSTTTALPHTLRSGCDTFVKNYRQIGIPLIFRAIPQFITREKISILKGAPCGFALIGLQTGSERTLNEVYQRKHSQKAFLNCAQLLDENDIPAIYDVIVDNPYETVADTRETVKVISELPSTAYLSLASLTFYKYTALYDKAKTDGFAVDDHLTKNQDAWNKSSKEVKAIKFAVFLGKESALEVLNGAHALTQVKFRLLNVLIAKVSGASTVFETHVPVARQEKDGLPGASCLPTRETSGKDTSLWNGLTSTRIDLGCFSAKTNRKNRDSEGFGATDVPSGSSVPVGVRKARMSPTKRGTHPWHQFCNPHVGASPSSHESVEPTAPSGHQQLAMTT